MQPLNPPGDEVALLIDKNLAPQKSHVHFCGSSPHPCQSVCSCVTPSLLSQDREEVLSLLNQSLHFLSPLALAACAVKGHNSLLSNQDTPLLADRL